MDFVKVGEESDSSTILEIKGLFLLSKVGSQNPMTDFDETRGNFDFAIFYFFLIFLLILKQVLFSHLEYPHTFTSELLGQDVVENDNCEFEIDVEAEDADVAWYQNGEPIDLNSGRFEIIKIGKKRKLVLKCAALADSGNITVKTNMEQSSCQLNVQCENDIIFGLPPRHSVWKSS